MKNIWNLKDLGIALLLSSTWIVLALWLDSYCYFLIYGVCSLMIYFDLVRNRRRK